MLSLTRRLAQNIRHNPRLSLLEPLWPVLRKPYLKFMTTFGQRRGIRVEVGGHRMRLHPRFCSLSWETVESESFRAFVNQIRPGYVVFDIGAFVGSYSLLALMRLGPLGKVVAYEPDDLARNYLQRHLEWNGGLSRTIVRDLCCGSASGTAPFYHVPGELEGKSGLVPVEGFQNRSAKVVTLDEETSRLGISPDLIKVDVEGAEWDVLKGAENVLIYKRPVLLLSLHPAALANRGETPDEVLDWLKARGFKHEVIGTDHEIHVLAKPSS